MKTMKLLKAEKEDFQRVRGFYHSLIDTMRERGLPVTWMKDIYPSPDFLRESIAAGDLYMACLGEGGEREPAKSASIEAVMVLNHSCNDEYHTVQWGRELKDPEVMVVHALGVHPDFGGKGIGREMINAAREKAVEAGAKALRLDVLKSNERAKNLYIRCGLTYRGTVQLYYENTGRQEFEMYEYLLPE